MGGNRKRKMGLLNYIAKGIFRIPHQVFMISVCDNQNSSSKRETFRVSLPRSNISTTIIDEYDETRASACQVTPPASPNKVVVTY